MHAAPASTTTAAPVALDQLVLQLSPGVTWSLRESGGQQYYLVEDAIQSRFLRVGVREHRYLARIDGSSTLGEIARNVAAEGAVEPLNDGELRVLGLWLVQTGVAHSPQLGIASADSAHGPAPWWQQLATNPLFIRVPLMRPDKPLSVIFPWMRWTLTRTAFLAWIAVVIWAMASLAMHRDEFGRRMSSILAPNNWAWLIVSWLGLKIVHETYHGLVCKLYGGTISQAGVIFVLFSPIAYVDVTSSWKFRDKWHRIHTAAAGMYAEFFIAAVAALIWCRLDDGWTRQFCHNVVMTASISTIVFNCNFLMRFDGYYIFSDLFEFQNLYANARQHVVQQLENWFLGIPRPAPLLDPWRMWVLCIYGWASLAWRTTFIVGILIVATQMFQGLGIVLAAITAVGCVVIPCLAWFRRQRARTGRGRANWLRFAVVTGCLAALAAGVAQLPWPGGVTAPAVVDYAPLHIVRVTSAGFVDRVCVEAGQPVEAGQVLVELRNPETLQRLEDLRLQVALSEAQGRALHRERRISEYMVENRRRQALGERLAQLEKEVDDLTIRATVPGRAIGRDLEALVGQFAQVGQELMAIGQEQHKQLEASVAQQDLDYFSSQVGQPAAIYLRGQGHLDADARLNRLNPRSSTLIPHPALAASAGGPLAIVVPNTQQASVSRQPAMQLAEARSTAIVSLPESTAERLHAGQLGYVKLASTPESIGTHLSRLVRQWFQRKSDRGAARS